MKNILLFFAMFLTVLQTVQAQTDVTKFLGIPVDGNKTEMRRKLEAKGFTWNSSLECLEGEFNGADVQVYIVTNNNKVYRILVADANYRNATDIKIRFNILCSQFKNNKKYTSFDIDYTIPDEENILYEIHNKRYEAIFYQLPVEEPDTARLKAEIEKNYTEEQFKKMPEDERMVLAYTLFIDLISKKTVWFRIDDNGFGKYRILMFYDNEYNQANGEDL